MPVTSSSINGSLDTMPNLTPLYPEMLLSYAKRMQPSINVSDTSHITIHGGPGFRFRPRTEHAKTLFENPDMLKSYHQYLELQYILRMAQIEVVLLPRQCEKEEMERKREEEKERREMEREMEREMKRKREEEMERREKERGEMERERERERENADIYGVTQYLNTPGDGEQPIEDIESAPPYIVQDDTPSTPRRRPSTPSSSIVRVDTPSTPQRRPSTPSSTIPRVHTPSTSPLPPLLSSINLASSIGRQHAHGLLTQAEARVSRWREHEKECDELRAQNAALVEKVEMLVEENREMAGLLRKALAMLYNDTGS